MAGFKGFGYISPEEIIAQTQQGFQQALQSGNPRQMRAAVMQQAAFALGGSPELRKSRKIQGILETAQKDAKQTGDEFEDQMSFYRNAQKLALEAGLPEVALQSLEKMSDLRLIQEERSRLKSAEGRAERTMEITEDRFEREEEDWEIEDTQRRLEERKTIAGVGYNAYNAAINSGADATRARQDAVQATLDYFKAGTKNGTLGEAVQAAIDSGYEDLLTSPDSFDPEGAAALSQDATPELKSLQTVMNPNTGLPELMYVVQTPSGPQMRPTGYTDFAALMAAAKGDGTGGKITDSQREAASFAFEMKKTEEIFNEFSFVKEDFTGVNDTLEGYLPNRVTSGDRQRYDAAKESFINAVLRRKSGATIKDDEYLREEKVYFPRAGDRPDSVVLKQDLRRRALAGMMASAGDEAYNNVVTQYLLIQSDAEAQELDNMGL